MFYSFYSDFIESCLNEGLNNIAATQAVTAENLLVKALKYV